VCFVWLLFCVFHRFKMPLVFITPAFIIQVTFRGMLRMFTFMPTSSPRLPKLPYLCKCLLFMCYTLVLSLLLLRVGFRFNLISFWGCLRLVSHAFVCFIRFLELFKMRSNELFVYALFKLLEIQWTNQHGSFSSCCHISVCVIFEEVI
jgi:hypothetical protein